MWRNLLKKFLMENLIFCAVAEVFNNFFVPLLGSWWLVYIDAFVSPTNIIVPVNVDAIIDNIISILSSHSILCSICELGWWTLPTQIVDFLFFFLLFLAITFNCFIKTIQIFTYFEARVFF